MNDEHEANMGDQGGWSKRAFLVKVYYDAMYDINRRMLIPGDFKKPPVRKEGRQCGDMQHF